MDELCPLCLKVGAKRKIKAVQVNLTEALWMCENEECPWPFGHEAPEIFHREVGEKWSFEWQVHRKLQKSVGPIPISTELSLYTPPVTPSSDAVSKDSSKTDISKNITDLTNVNNILSSNSYAPRSTDQLISPKSAEISIGNLVSSDRKNIGNIANQGSSVLSSIFDIDGDELLKNKINSPPISVKNDLDVRNAADRHEKVLEKSRNSRNKLEKSVIETDLPIETKAVPSIRSIAKANIDLQRFNPSEIVSTNKKVDSSEKSVFDSEPATPPSDFDDKLNFPNSDLNFPKQHTTTIKVEGIPPITLSYDLADLDGKIDMIVPLTSTPLQKPAKRTAVFVETKINDEKPEEESPKKQTKLTEKRRTALGKRYEKFSFSKLRKIGNETKEINDKSNIINAEMIPVKKEDVGLDGTALDCKKQVSSGTEASVSNFSAAENQRNKTFNETEMPIKKESRLNEAVLDCKKQVSMSSNTLVRDFSAISADGASKIPGIGGADLIEIVKKEEIQDGEGVSDCKKQDSFNSETLVPNFSATDDSRMNILNSFGTVKKEEKQDLEQLVPSFSARNGPAIVKNPGITDFDDLTKNFDRSDGSINCLASDSQSVENLSVGCLLDDMLLDGYRDDSKNLNDDWLESFFT